MSSEKEKLDLEHDNLRELQPLSTVRRMEETEEEIELQNKLLDEVVHNTAEIESNKDADGNPTDITIKRDGKTVFYEDQAGIEKLTQQDRMRDGLRTRKRSVQQAEENDPMFRPLPGEDTKKGN